MSHSKIVGFDRKRVETSIKRYYLVNHTENRSLLTKRLLSDSMLWAEGYLCCLKGMGEEPFIEKDVYSLLIEEVARYINQRIQLNKACDFKKQG